MPNARSKSADALLAEAARIKDPIGRLERIAEARTAHTDTTDKIAAHTEAAIGDARQVGATWPTIGHILGVSPQRAQQLSRRETVTA